LGRETRAATIELLSQQLAEVLDLHLQGNHSHSIINGFGKSLFDLMHVSNPCGSTVRSFAIWSAIPERSVHHRSTSMKNSRRFHNGLLSRSIAIYSLLCMRSLEREQTICCWRSIQEDLGIEYLNVLSHRIFLATFLPPPSFPRRSSASVRIDGLLRCSFHGLILQMPLLIREPQLIRND
jgi:hypothetical protein